MQKEAEKFAQSSLMEGMFSIRAVLRAYQHVEALFGKERRVFRLFDNEGGGDYYAYERSDQGCVKRRPLTVAQRRQDRYN